MVIKNLPRGGKKSNIKSSNTLFTKLRTIKTKKHKSKLKIKERTSLQDVSVFLNTVHNLRYSALHKGMIILGRIFKISDYYAIVSLPGQLSGKLQASDISKSYTNLLKNVANNKELNEFITLSEIYKEGDYVICYVKDFYSDYKKVTLSLQPQLINQNLNPRFLEKGSKVILSCSSVEDHGYVLETGLKNLRAFLSLKDVENKVKMHPGNQILCAIKDIKIVENIFTVQVSVKSKHLETIKTDIPFLNNLIPGIKYSLTVKKIMKNGLQVYYGEKYIGYINQLYLQNILSSYEEGQELFGILLYTLPIIKVAYFSLISLEQEEKLLKIGDIITKAKVISHDMRGIFVQLNKDERGFIPVKRTEVDFEKIDSVFIGKSIHKCKIISYDLIAKLYICTMEKKLINKQPINYIDLQPGDIVNVTITAINEKKGYITVSADQIFGIVPPDQVSDPGSMNILKVGQNVTARVLQSSAKIIFTLKKSLLETKLPILYKTQDAKVNSAYDGSIVKITKQGILVHFFGNVKGWIPRRFLNSQTVSQNWNFVIGQTIKTIIKNINIDENKITLAPLNNRKIQNIKYKIGDIVEGVIIDSSTAGVYLRIKNEHEEEGTLAFLPAGHMSPCYEVGKLLASKTVAGNVLSAIVFSTNSNLILSSTFAPKKAYKINDLSPGDIVLCSIMNIFKDSIKVLLPIINCFTYGVVPINEAENIEYLYENQILFGKILKIDKIVKKIDVTIQFSKVWKNAAEHEVKIMTAVDVLSCYLNKMFELSKNVFYTSKPISNIQIGELIKGIVESIIDYGLIVKLENNIKGIVRINNFFGNYKQGDEVEGSVLWVNYPNEYVEITLLHRIMKSIMVNQNKLAKIPIGVLLRGEIVLVSNWFVLVILKGKAKGTLVGLPVRRHLNDIFPDTFPYQIGGKIRCYCILNKDETDLLLPICILKSSFEVHISKVKKPLNSSLKYKMKIIDESKSATTVPKLKTINNTANIHKEIIEETNQKIIKKNAEIIKSACEKEIKKFKISNETKLNKRKRNENRKIPYTIQSEVKIETPRVNTNFMLDLSIAKCEFKWDNSSIKQMCKESSSDSEKEFEEPTQKSKKKKLSASEKKELERQKEQEICEHEEVMASCQVPQTVDQFDRLILSSPDSSLIWIQYMAHYLQATEIDKARAVARRALRTISFREESEKLNIWQAWLNLESSFGSSESLTKIFQEAIKMSDAQKIYEHMLIIYTNAGKQSEVEETVNTMIAKFKRNPDTWISCGAATMKIGMKNKSRHIMQRALQSLSESKHVDLMVRFAQLENKFGEVERSQTLFEQILSSYAKRIDVWSSYVELLIKLGKIEVARKILDRAIVQDLPVRKMKILFKKYINFEEKFGTLENVSRIQELAVKYIEKQCKNVN